MIFFCQLSGLFLKRVGRNPFLSSSSDHIFKKVSTVKKIENIGQYYILDQGKGNSYVFFHKTVSCSTLIVEIPEQSPV